MNLKNHGISFEEAQTVFIDEMARIFFDESHSVDEKREIIIHLRSFYHGGIGEYDSARVDYNHAQNSESKSFSQNIKDGKLVSFVFNVGDDIAQVSPQGYKNGELIVGILSKGDAKDETWR